MIDQDCSAWIVKFQNNPQHRRVLVNEYVAARLAQQIGLSVPEVTSIDTADWSWATAKTICPEPQCAIRFAGGLLPDLVSTWQPKQALCHIRNRRELAGIALLDLWLTNTDRRQLVLVRRAREVKRKAVFIDQGACFGSEQWLLGLSGAANRFLQTCDDLSLRHFGDFLPWLDRIHTLTAADMSSCLSGLPAQWYEGESEQLVDLMQRVDERRWYLFGLLRSIWRERTSERPSEPVAYQGCLEFRSTAIQTSH